MKKQLHVYLREDIKSRFLAWCDEKDITATKVLENYIKKIITDEEVEVMAPTKSDEEDAGMIKIMDRLLDKIERLEQDREACTCRLEKKSVKQ